MPTFMASSGVSLPLLARPRMPSVPKYLRAMLNPLIQIPDNPSGYRKRSCRKTLERNWDFRPPDYTIFRLDQPKT